MKRPTAVSADGTQYPGRVSAAREKWPDAEPQQRRDDERRPGIGRRFEEEARQPHRHRRDHDA